MKQKKSIKFFVIYVVIAYVTGAIAYMHSLIYTIQNHLDDFDGSPLGKLIVTGAILLIWNPVLVTTIRYAILEKEKVIAIVAIFHLVIQTIVVVYEVLPIIRMYLGS